jgi:hypothetical protein
LRKVSLLVGAAGLAAAHLACGGSPSLPTTPATPVPIPTPTPTPPIGFGIPPESSGCGKPYPPPLIQINVKLHFRGPAYFTLDATPLVGVSGEFCREIGYTDGRVICPVRLEGDPERVPCEAWLMGNAEDTGKPGPTWSRDLEHWCTTIEESTCAHNSETNNPWSLWVTVSGRYQACKGDELCGQYFLER